MEELIRILENIATNVGGEWKENVLIDNDTDNPLVNAYNEGVKAMGNQACYFVSAILGCKEAELKMKEIMKVGEQ